MPRRSDENVQTTEIVYVCLRLSRRHSRACLRQQEARRSLYMRLVLGRWHTETLQRRCQALAQLLSALAPSGRIDLTLRWGPELSGGGVDPGRAGLMATVYPQAG